MNRSLIIDGTYLLYRNMHTESSWDLGTGDVQTGGTFVFLRTLHHALSRINGVNRVLVVFDGGRSTRRTSLYPEYKANRDQRSPEMKVRGQVVDIKSEINNQKRMLDEILPFLGIRVAQLPGREGDDLIYAASRITGSSVIMTDDGDMLAMIRPTISVFRPRIGVHYTWDIFADEFGYDPDIHLYFKAITGDASDNVKGVKGAGKATATTFCQLLQKNNRDVEATLTECMAGDYRLRAIPEQRDVLGRNLQLMDCAEETLTADELAYLRTSLYQPSNGPQHSEFLTVCDKLKFSTLSGDAWFVPFMNLK